MLLVRLQSLLFVTILITGCCGEIYAGDQEVDISPLYDKDIDIGSVQQIKDIIDLSLFDTIHNLKDPILSQDSYSGAFISAIFFDGGKLLEELPGITRSYVEVTLILEKDSLEASKYINSECESPLFIDKTRIIKGGIEDNRYCISYIKEIRDSIEVFCLPRNEYSSFVIFQKGRLIIFLDEFSTVPNTSNKNIIIQFLADNLKNR